MAMWARPGTDLSMTTCMGIIMTRGSSAVSGAVTITPSAGMSTAAGIARLAGGALPAARRAGGSAAGFMAEDSMGAGVFTAGEAFTVVVDFTVAEAGTVDSTADEKTLWSVKD